jgi:hypothetical protein
MNVGSIFELANRTGLWMFCGVRREDDVSGPRGPVAELVGIDGGVVSGVINLESPDVEASGRRPRHEEHYHEA